MPELLTAPTDDGLTGNRTDVVPFLLASDEEMLIGRGIASVLSVAPGSAADAAARFFASPTSPVLPRAIVGAFPFDDDREPFLYQPQSFARTPAGATNGGVGSSYAWSVTADPPRPIYERNVTRALALMDDAGSALRKVVLSRSLVLRANAPIDVATLVTRLRADRAATTYAMPLPSAGSASRVLVGATPELLLEKRGSRVVSEPLAGSARRKAGAAADRAAAESLTRSDKDAREHSAVVEWVADHLSPFCAQLRVPAKPSLRSTTTMWHLGTRIEGTLKNPHESSIALAERLHPTPAVCGLPVDRARDVIRNLEPFDRGFFAGAIGWCDERGDGRWLVAIRCAEIEHDTARLFAGAGIVPGSDPAAEATETSAKFGALLRALGVSDQAVRDADAAHGR